MSYPYRSYQPREPVQRRNGKIRAREVRVIDENREQLGVLPLGDALRLAQRKGLDLIEIAPNATPPVCRIVDYGKFRYEQAKKEKESHRPAAGKMKEIQLSAAIDPHDLATKLNHAIGFLCDDMKVRVRLRFKGRQKAHKEFGYEVMNKFVNDLALYAQADAPPKILGGRDLNVVLTPLSREKRARNAAAAREAAPPPA